MWGKAGGGVVALLNHALAAGDINQCCGLLRRLYSELSPATETALLYSATYNNHNRSAKNAAANRGGTDTAVLTSSTSSSSSSSLPLGSSGAEASAAQAADESFAARLLQLGRLCLKENPSLVKPSSVHVMCHTAHRCGKWRDALWLCDYLEGEPPPIFLSSLLTPENVHPILSLCGDKGWPLDVTNATRELAGRHGSWVSALAVAKDAEARFPTGESYSVGILVPYLAASGHQAEAHRLFKAGVAHGAMVDTSFMQQVLRQTADAQQWQTCLFMLDTLSKTFETAPLLPRDSEFYRKLIEMTPCWLSSLRLFTLLRTAEVKPDKRLISTLLTQCDEAGAWAEATRIYDLAVQEGFRESFALGSTYHTLVRAFAAVRQWERALEALSWMSKASHASTIAGKCELVEICEHAGQWEAALAVGSSLLEDQPELLSSQTLLSLLLACAKGAQWEMAIRIFGIQQSDVRVEAHPLSVCAVLQSCIAADRWTEALAVFHEARQQQPRTVVPPMAHRLAVKACVGAGRWSQAMSLLEVMRKDGLPHDNHSQRLGMWAAALGGQWELSLSFLQRIPPRTRTLQDRLVVRNATRYVSPTANAIALRYLQSK